MRQDQSVETGAQLGKGIGLVLEVHRLGSFEQGNLNAGAIEFVFAERREAWIAKRRSDRIFGDVLRQRPMRLQAADTSAQITVLRQRDESRRRICQCRVRNDRTGTASELFFDGVARDGQQREPEGICAHAESLLCVSR